MTLETSPPEAPTRHRVPMKVSRRLGYLLVGVGYVVSAFLLPGLLGSAALLITSVLMAVLGARTNAGLRDGVLEVDARGATARGPDGKLRLYVDRVEVVDGWMDHGSLRLVSPSGETLWAMVERSAATGIIERFATPPREGTFAVPISPRPHLQIAILLVLVTIVSMLAFKLGNLHTASRVLLLAAGAFSFLAFLFMSGFARWRRRARVVAGRDGVAVHTLFGKRFWPYAAIAHVDPCVGGFELHLRTGQAILVRLFDANRTPPSERLATRRAARLIEYIEERRRASSEAPAAKEAYADLLERNGRGAEAWRTELRALPSRVDYRQGAVDRVELLRIVEDPGVRAELRIGAALALGGDSDGQARLRLRAAVDDCADHDVRTAIEEAAEGELSQRTMEKALGRRAL